MRRVNNERIKGVVGDEKRRMVGEEWKERERKIEWFVPLLPRARFTWSRGRHDSLSIIIICVNGREKDGKGTSSLSSTCSSSRGAALRKGGGEIPFQLSNNDALPPLPFPSSNLFCSDFWLRKSWGFLTVNLMLTSLGKCFEFFEVINFDSFGNVWRNDMKRLRKINVVYVTSSSCFSYSRIA